MAKLLILQGPPACGKSTFAVHYAAQYKKKRVIVSRDAIRESIGEYGFLHENLVTKIERTAVATALAEGKEVILDATNLNPTHLKYWSDTYGEIIETKEFILPYDEALERDKHSNRKRPVGRKVLRSFYTRYYPDMLGKKDDRDYSGQGDPTLNNCIICDIDGTISLMNGRDPFKGQDCASDKPNVPVIKLLQNYSKSHTIILFSGRNGESEEQTKQWLEDNDVPYDKLVMREAGNYEKDSSLKERFFYEHVKGKYFVEFVLDDRDQVVDTWRNKLNLPCFQVYYGKF